MKEALYYKKKNGEVQCSLCPHNCEITEHKRGRCGVRTNKGGVLYSPSAFFMKHPPRQFPDDIAYKMTEEFIAGQDIEGTHISGGNGDKTAHEESDEFIAK